MIVSIIRALLVSVAISFPDLGQAPRLAEVLPLHLRHRRSRTNLLHVAVERRGGRTRGGTGRIGAATGLQAGEGAERDEDLHGAQELQLGQSSGVGPRVGNLFKGKRLSFKCEVTILSDCCS